MVQAIEDNTNWTSANTCVTLEDGISKVYLHGNLIAEIDEDSLKLNDGGYQSKTTKSRLNVILTKYGVDGESVFQKNFEWFIRLWNGTEFFTTEFRNGMRLA